MFLGNLIAINYHHSTSTNAPPLPYCLNKVEYYHTHLKLLTMGFNGEAIWCTCKVVSYVWLCDFKHLSAPLAHSYRPATLGPVMQAVVVAMDVQTASVRMI